MNHLLAFVLGVENEDRAAEFNWLTILARVEGKGCVAEFFADILAFDPAPVATTATHFVLAVFAGNVAEVSPAFELFDYFLSGLTQWDESLIGHRSQNDLTQMERLRLIEADFVFDVEFLNPLWADLGL